MKDLRVVQAKVLLPIHSVAPVRGFQPASVIVVGERFHLAQEILFNGVNADEFIISSPNRLLVRIPPSQLGKTLSEIQVLSTVPVSRTNAIMQLGLQRPLQTIQGIDRCIQSYLILFMTTPGTDIWSPDSGGGGRAIIGRPTDRSGRNVAADLAQSLDRAKTELIRLQALDRRIPPSERLLSANLESIDFDEETTVLSAKVDIRNVLGENAKVSLR